MQPKLLLSVLSWGLAWSLAGSLVSAAPRIATGSTVRIQMSAEPVTLDPARAEDGISFRILLNTMDGLMGYDSRGRLEKRLAESTLVLQGGKTYRIRLSPKARWSDGREVKAQDFVAAIRRALDPKTASKLAALLFDIRGAREKYRGQTADLGVREVAGSQGRELEFQLEKPVSYFLDVLTLPMTFPTREDVLAAHGGSWPLQAPVTGPYRIAERRIEQWIRLEPNPNSIRATSSLPGVPPSIELRLVQDESTAMRLFESGMLDVLTRVSTYDRERLGKQGLLKVDPYYATYFLGFNTRQAPFSDRKVRQAVAGAIRRDELCRLLGTGEKPATSWIPEGLEGAEPYREPSGIFASAMAQVKEKWAQAKAPFVTAGFDGGSRNALVMEKVQADLKAGLGLSLQLANVDWKTHVRQLSAEPPALFRFGIQAPFADPIFHLQALTSTDPNNYTGWKNRDYDGWVDRIRGLKPGKERTALIQKAQRLLTDQEAVVIPLYHYTQLHAVAARVQGFAANPFGVIRFSELRVRESGGS